MSGAWIDRNMSLPWREKREEAGRGLPQERLPRSFFLPLVLGSENFLTGRAQGTGAPMRQRERGG